MSTSKQLIGLLVAAAIASGCGGSTELRLRDGTWVSGKVVRSTADSVWLETLETDADYYGRDAAHGVCVEADGASDSGFVLRPSETCTDGERLRHVNDTVRVQRKDLAEGDRPGNGGEGDRPGNGPEGDRPGNGPEVAMIAGGVLLAIAGVFAIKAEAAPDNCCGSDGTDCACYGPSEQSAGHMTAALFAVPGLGLETYGLLTYTGSRSRSAPPTTEPSSPVKDAKGVRLRFQF